MEKTYKVKVYDIDYCVEDEDVCSEVDNNPEIEEDSEEYYEEIKRLVKTTKENLPKDLTIEVECEEEDLEDEVCNTTTELTGWLLNGFKYEILNERSN